MTLSEIETILQELSSRHQNLTEDLLVTLLAAAGWEDKVIKDALVLFKQKKDTLSHPASVSSVTKAKPQINTAGTSLDQTGSVASAIATPTEITFYQPDGTEEGKLHAFTETPATDSTKQRVLPNSAPAATPVGLDVSPKISSEVSQTTEVIGQEVSEHAPAPQVVLSAPVPEAVQPVQAQALTEPQSLISHEEVAEKKVPEKQGILPNNLPLLPFESSPHVWSFAKYKDVFHGDAPVHEEMKVITVMPQEDTAHSIQSSTLVTTTSPSREGDAEVVVEPTPLRKDDKPLVFLATIMLFAIILILGYMYSNGRL